MDNADRANDLIELDRSNRIQSILADQVPTTKLAGDCEECGDPIPAARLAIVNTDFCAGCASILEGAQCSRA